MNLSDYFDENGVLKRHVIFTPKIGIKLGYPCTINDGESNSISGRLIIIPDDLNDLKREELILKIVELREDLSYVLRQILLDYSAKELADLLYKDLNWIEEKLNDS